DHFLGYGPWCKPRVGECGAGNRKLSSESTLFLGYGPWCKPRVGECGAGNRKLSSESTQPAEISWSRHNFADKHL
ncbi:hypothetical protein T265_04143, partial [Opisthorchis viverrini]